VSPAPARPFDQDAEFGHPIPLPHAALVTAREFIRTAVLREHLGRSWPLLAPSYRHGFTRAQWLTGNIPVVPFPAKSFAQARCGRPLARPRRAARGAHTLDGEGARRAGRPGVLHRPRARRRRLARALLGAEGREPADPGDAELRLTPA
jgi:hypothetical protein